MSRPRFSWVLSVFAAVVLLVAFGTRWNRSQISNAPSVAPPESMQSFETRQHSDEVEAELPQQLSVPSLAGSEIPKTSPSGGAAPVPSDRESNPCAALPSGAFSYRDAEGNVDCGLLFGSREAEPPALGPEISSQQQQALLAQEAREAAWATSAEGRLRGAFARVEDLRYSSMNVQCKTTVCAVDLIYGESMPMAEANRTVFRRVARSLDGIALENGLKDPHMVPGSNGGFPIFRFLFSRE